MKMLKQSLLQVPVLLVLFVNSHIVDAQYRTWQEILCEQANPELKACYRNLYCPEGYLWKDGCPVCACRNSICQGRCGYGERCSILKQTGQYPGQVTDIAICERALPIVTQAPVETTQASTTKEPPYLGPCDYQGRCDATGRCPSINSVCRSDGLCCRVKTKIDYNIAGKLDMARCKDKPDIGRCKGLAVQYVYNMTTGRCQSMMFGGCTVSLNHFPTMEQCQTTCEDPCKKPKTLGRCRASIPRYYFDEDTELCKPFDLGGCAGEGQYFMTPWDCETHCKGLRKKFDPYENRGQPRSSTTTTTTTTTTIKPNIIPDNGNGLIDVRQKTRQRVIDHFKKSPKLQNRQNPDTVGDDGKVIFKPRPTPSGGNFYIDSKGRYIAVDTTQPTAPPTAPTTVPTDRNQGGGGYFRYLADRYRSAHNIVKSQSGGQLNFNKPRTGSRGNGPTPVQDRDLEGNSDGDTYQNSVDALRQYISFRG